MGIIRHDAIVITAEHDLEEAHAVAVFIFGDQVTSVARGVVNNSHTFCIAPDGSKEGWADSEVGDERRKTFIEWAESDRPKRGFHWVAVNFGPDDPGHPLIAGFSGEDDE